MKRVCIAATAVLLALPTFTAHSQDHTHPVGKAAEKLGTVHFSTSCSPSVAAQFDRAVALLHSFEFGASIKGFNEVLAADSTCAMAHWGIALSRWTNPTAAGIRTAAQLSQGRQAVDAALRLAARASARERGYVHAVSRLYDAGQPDQRARIVAYERAMSELVTQHPADTEARIFYAISLTASAPPTDKTYANQLKAGSILQPLLAAQPNHPGLSHYIIHSYDFPPLAEKAREAARTYASIAPSAAPGSAGFFALAAIPARWALERDAWAEAASLEPRATAYPYTEAMTYFARALGASRTRDPAKARVAIDSLASIQQQLSAKGEAFWAEQVAIQHLAARAWLDVVEKRETEALARMREAAVREDATEKSPVTPGPLAPARELLGDMLMELNRPAEARVEYLATLEKEPNRRRSLRRVGRDASRK